MNLTKITSISNPKIKQALDIKNKRSRYRHNAFIIEGPNLIEMAMTSGHEIKEVFFTNGFSLKKDGQKLLRCILKNTNEIFGVTEHILHKLADTETARGIIAIASYKPKSLAEISFRSIPLIVIADGIQDPGNLGTIIRTSDAAGVDAVIILPGTCDVFMQKTLRATAGSIFNIPIVFAGADELIEWLKTKTIGLIATTLNTKISIFDSNLKKSLAFVFGNEAYGISEKIKNNADLVLKIPLIGKAESLNVSSAASVCLYEAVRQRMLL